MDKKDQIITVTLAIIIIVLYQLIGFDQALTIRRQVVEIRVARDLIAVQEAYIAELESRLADKHTRDVIVTAYTARVEECDEDPGHTAFMMRPTPGLTVAVSRDLLADGWTPGKQIYVPGHGVRVIQDIMNIRYTNRIDILMPTVNEAMQVAPSVKRVCLIMSHLSQ